MQIPKGTFFGEIKNLMTNRDYVLMDSHHTPKTAIPYHFHDAPYFSLVLTGRIEEKNRLSTYQRKPGTLVYHPVGYGHCNAIYSEDSRVFNIQLSGSLLDYVDFYSSKSEFKFIFNEKVVSQMRKIYRMFLEKWKSKRIHDEISRLIELVGTDRGARNLLYCPDWFKRVLEYIDRHYSEAILLDDLSLLVDKHPAHISRMFKDNLHCSMNDYIHKIRIERACERLRSEKISISALAYELGYSDHSHFSRTFIEMTGLPPSGYRKLLSS